MSAKWSVLIFYFPPVPRVPFMHGFCGFPHILGRACLACDKVHHTAGLTVQFVSYTVGQPSEGAYKLLGDLDFREQKTTSAPSAMIMSVAPWNKNITAVL